MVDQKQKILIVDDDAFVRDMLSDILESENFIIETAENGLNALKKYCANKDISLIVSDMSMPEMDGLGLIKELRKSKSDVPVIILTGSTEISVALEAIKSGANDYLIKDENIQDTILLSVKNTIEKQQMKEQNVKLLAELAKKNTELENFNETLEGIVQTLTHIGTALSSEKNLQKLLEMIVSEARSVTNADGGTLYILEDKLLYFKILQNTSMNIFMGGVSGKPISTPPVPLAKSNVCAYCALEKKVITIPDVYESSEFDFSGPKEYDRASGYKTKSMAVVPMLDHGGEVVGVLQLINSIDIKTKEIVSFSGKQLEVAKSLASQAAVSIENARSYEKIQNKNRAFERFVPAEFLSMLGKVEVEDINLGDSTFEEDLSVLFSDIRTFTNLSESMTPEECFFFLNGYLKNIGPVISKSGGFIDKYIGDAIMAIFSGTKKGVADDAVIAAVNMQKMVKVYNGYRKNCDYQPIAIGIGIHTGPVTLGTIGFEKRIESTAIGDTVNLASRVESLTKFYGVNVAITSTTFDRLKDSSKYCIQEIDTVQVVGKKNAIKIYSVFDSDPENIKEIKVTMLDRYNEGINLYKQRKWSEALKIFNELKSTLNSDNVIDIYKKRCQTYLDTPPDESWNGVTKLDEK